MGEIGFGYSRIITREDSTPQTHLRHSYPRKAVRLKFLVWGVTKSLAAPMVVTLGEGEAFSGGFTLGPRFLHCKKAGR